MKIFIILSGLCVQLSFMSCSPKECTQGQIDAYNQAIALDASYDICQAYVKNFKDDCMVNRTDPKRGPFILETKKIAASCK